jgi:hypothetical protein
MWRSPPHTNCSHYCSRAWNPSKTVLLVIRMQSGSLSCFIAFIIQLQQYKMLRFFLWDSVVQSQLHSNPVCKNHKILWYFKPFLLSDNTVLWRISMKHVISTNIPNGSAAHISSRPHSASTSDPSKCRYSCQASRKMVATAQPAMKWILITVMER